MNEVHTQKHRSALLVRKFREEHGDDILNFACYAAIPVVLDVNLLHLLRINFFFDTAEIVSYLDESRLLLSPLCHEIGDGMYEMDPGVRAHLLQHLVTEHDYMRVREIAALLWEYTRKRKYEHDNISLERAQQFTALSFLSPAKAQEWLNYTNWSVLRPHGLKREWYVAILAEQQKLDELISIGQNDHADPSDILEKYLAEFVNRIVPSYDQTLGIYSSINEYHSRMLKANGLPGKYAETRLFGSLKRRTAIYPTDVDILSIMQTENPRNFERPTYIHRGLKKELERIYGVRNINNRGRRSMSFGASIIVTVGKYTFEILPAITSPDHPNNIMIPTVRLREWDRLNFDIHENFTVVQNKNTHGQYSALVQLIKWWARYHNISSPYLAGFTIEALVADCMTHKYESLCVGFIDTLGKIHNKCTETKRALQIPDPAIPNRMLERVIPRVGVRNLVMAIEESLSLAQQSTKTDEIEKKLEYWEKIFGPTFIDGESFVIRKAQQSRRLNETGSKRNVVTSTSSSTQQPQPNAQSSYLRQAEHDLLVQKIMNKLNVTHVHENIESKGPPTIAQPAENPKPSETAVQLTSIEQVKRGMLVKGVVEEIDANRISVNVGLKESASITFQRLNVKPSDLREVEKILPKGTTIEAYVVRVNKKGRIQLRPSTTE